MKTATVAELRNEFPKIARWLAAGEVVQITRRGKHIANLQPADRSEPGSRPDFAARLNELYGEHCAPDTVDLLNVDREDPG